jgi:6-phosphogluconate dehydrogenase
MITYNFGIVGLGVMGRNLLLNMADNGYAVAGLDLDQEKSFITGRSTGRPPNLCYG